MLHAKLCRLFSPDCGGIAPGAVCVLPENAAEQLELKAGVKAALSGMS